MANSEKRIPERLSRSGPEIMAGDTPEKTEEAVCRHLISPEFAATAIIQNSNNIAGPIDFPSLSKVLQEDAEKIKSGDMSKPEAMLINQAVALQSLFQRLTERSLKSENMDHCEKFMRLALKAQAQSRATLETLSNIKNPPVVYTKQANIAAGHQQINNGNNDSSRTREIKTEQNQLLEVGRNEQWLDTGTQGETSKIDPDMATLETFDRAKNQSG